MHTKNEKMKKTTGIGQVLFLLILGSLSLLIGCNETVQKLTKKELQKALYPSDVIPFFYNWKLVLGNGSNIGFAIQYKHHDYFYTVNDGTNDWIVFKAPIKGVNNSTIKNTRTELEQVKKWYPQTAKEKLSATLKVKNVSATGDARLGASYSVVVGQINSTDGHKNQPLKIFYKKFPGHTKGSVFWCYDTNSKSDENAQRWDYSEAVWGHDFSVVGSSEKICPEEPKDGIALGEEFSYQIAVEAGIMHLTFISKDHKTKTFTKNLMKLENDVTTPIPDQKQELFVPIGELDAKSYAGEGLFFKLGAFNETEQNALKFTENTPVNNTIQKQYKDGNYSEVWFKTASLFVSDNAVSNEDYFIKSKP